MKTAHVRIEGRVQGVWFRGWTVDEAQSRHLSGWVRNRADGSVEALFHGNDEAVRDMLHRCHEGPPAAVVRAVVPMEPLSDVPFEEGVFRQMGSY